MIHAWIMVGEEQGLRWAFLGDEQWAAGFVQRSETVFSSFQRSQNFFQKFKDQTWSIYVAHLQDLNIGPCTYCPWIIILSAVVSFFPFSFSSFPPDFVSCEGCLILAGFAGFQYKRIASYERFKLGFVEKDPLSHPRI